MHKLVQAKRIHRDYLLSLPNVVGVGVGEKKSGGRSTGEMAIVVYVSRKVDVGDLAEGERIPAILDGVPTDVQIQAPMRARGSD